MVQNVPCIGCVQATHMDHGYMCVCYALAAYTKHDENLDSDVSRPSITRIPFGWIFHNDHDETLHFNEVIGNSTPIAICPPPPGHLEYKALSA